LFWLELLNESGLMKEENLEEITNKVEELVKIFASYRKKIKG